MTVTANKSSYNYAILQARKSLKRGDRLSSRRWAERAAALDPKQEEPWLIIAAMAAPRASLEYLKQALAINPQSRHARKGMHWAIQRYRSEAAHHLRSSNFNQNIVITPDVTRQKRTGLYPWMIVLLALLVGVAIWFGTPAFSSASNQTQNMLAFAQEWVGLASRTPTPTATYTPTPTYTSSPTHTPSLTPTSTFTHTPTQTPTNTPTDTQTPIPSNTATPVPTATHQQESESGNKPPQISLPPNIKKGEIWIDIDLSNQQLSVFKGKNLLDTFIVSTGTWRTPTVTGQYRIYVKYPAADMSGPGYYLPSVPYVMYFYKGYGIHGTYWHNNFGTPMSHGCINLRTDNAEWVYNKSVVGTLVNIHY